MRRVAATTAGSQQPPPSCTCSRTIERRSRSTHTHTKHTHFSSVRLFVAHLPPFLCLLLPPPSFLQKPKDAKPPPPKSVKKRATSAVVVTPEYFCFFSLSLSLSLSLSTSQTQKARLLPSSGPRKRGEGGETEDGRTNERNERGQLLLQNAAAHSCFALSGIMDRKEKKHMYKYKYKYKRSCSRILRRRSN